MDSEASVVEEHIEYVELLDSDVYDQENTSELIEIHDDTNAEDAEGIMHEIVTITDANDVNMLENYEEIQYVEAEVEVAENSLLNHENQTIFIHDGRKYVISNDQLTSGDQTIILDEEDGQLIQQEEQDNNHEEIESPQMYYTSAMETEGGGTSNELVGRQFAVLKDGKLHLTNIEDDGNTEIRQFESTLTNYEQLNEEQEDIAETGDEDDENDKQLSEITGRNLITGQTISLSGILEKMRRKTNVNDLLNINMKQQRNTTMNQQQPQQDYVLVPPVTRRVVVGRTQDGKRLVGRILQIQKKIQPNDLKINKSSRNTFTIAMPTEDTVKPKRKDPRQLQMMVDKRREKKREADEKKSNQIMQLRYVSRSVLDENVARTLAGLMDLESINKRLKGRRLIVRHIQRRSRDGKIITGSKKIAYYCGRLKRQTATDNWTFVQEYPTKGFDENGIDLPNNEDGADNSDKVNLRLSDDGHSILSDAVDATKPPAAANQKDFESNETDETLTLYLTETQDEYGKKKTKVTIPQFVAGHATRGATQQRTNEDYLCKFCGKRFQTVASLKRHATVHDHSLRPLQCLTCLGRFTDESSLKKHMILHTGLRPHKCHLCDKSFAHRGDLNFHSRTHDLVKRYECDVCKKQFNRHSNMLRHAEIHRPFNKAPEGDSGSSSNQSIIILNATTDDYDHSSNHGNEAEIDPLAKTTTPFTCDQCGIQYNFSSSLTRHIVNVHLKQMDES